MIEVKNQLCCYQGQKIAGCCYQGKKIAGCCYQGHFFFINSGRLPFEFCISINQNFFLMNLWSIREFDTLYKITTDIFPVYLTRNVKKTLFFLKKINLLEFCWSVVIRVKNQLTVIIREMNPKNNRCRSFSQTADISAITHQFKVVVSPFERGHSKDYGNAKIISIECKIAVHRVNQVISFFQCCYQGQ